MPADAAQLPETFIALRHLLAARLQQALDALHEPFWLWVHSSIRPIVQAQDKALYLDAQRWFRDPTTTEPLCVASICNCLGHKYEAVMELVRVSYLRRKKIQADVEQFAIKNMPAILDFIDESKKKHSETHNIVHVVFTEDEIEYRRALARFHMGREPEPVEPSTTVTFPRRLVAKLKESGVIVT